MLLERLLGRKGSKRVETLSRTWTPEFTPESKG
jgi:hypothetical protein